MAHVKKREEMEKYGSPNETNPSEVMPVRYCGEGWSETWMARIGLEYNENGLLKRNILHAYDEEVRLVGKEILSGCLSGSIDF